MRKRPHWLALVLWAFAIIGPLTDIVNDVIVFMAHPTSFDADW
jgi:hypothetical protein